MRNFLIRFLIVLILLVSIITMINLTHKDTEYPEEATVEVVIEDQEVIEEYIPDEEDVEAIAKTLYGECRGVSSIEEKAAVVWCILNRLDAGYADSVLGVVSAPNQFVGYDEAHPVLEELEYIAEDVLIRHYLESKGNTDVGRVLPSDYIYFTGDGERNHFRNEYNSSEYWDWSLDDIYN